MARKGWTILALDLGTNTGWALSLAKSGTHHFEIDYREAPGMLWDRFYDWLEGMIVEHDVEEIIYESCVHQKGHAARVINSLVCIVELLSFKHGVTVRGCHQSTLKKHATGTGKHGKGQSKLEMKRAARKKWPKKKYVDDNHIDALWLLDYARTNDYE